MKWFKHDSDASQDVKLKKLLMLSGIEGWGFYWYCVERIASKLSKENIDFSLEDDIEILAHDLRIKTSRAEELINLCLEIGLFILNGDKKPVCLALAKRLDNTIIQNPEIKKIVTSNGFKQLKETFSVFQQNRLEQTRIDKTRTDNILSGQSPDLVTSFIQKEEREECRVPHAEIIDFLNKQSKRQFKSDNKATQRLIKARWNEGYRIPDFQAVINIKVRQWLHDDKMVQYLRPQTLFGSKFECYLNDARTNQKKEELICPQCGARNGRHIESCLVISSEANAPNAGMAAERRREEG